MFCILDEFDNLIADDDQLDKYEPWCHTLVVDEIVDCRKLHDNEEVILYKEGDFDCSDGKGDDALMCKLHMFSCGCSNIIIVKCFKLIIIYFSIFL